jgi:hypothetical protein
MSVTAAKLQRSLDREARKTDPDARAAADKAVQAFLLAAHQLAADGILDADDIKLLTKFAVSEHLIPDLDTEGYKEAEASGLLDRYSLSDEDRPAAEHAARRVAAIHIGKLVADGHMKPDEAKQLLSSEIEWPEHDGDPEEAPIDEDVIAALAELASGEDHPKLRGLNDTRPHPEDMAALDSWISEMYPSRGKSKGTAPKAIASPQVFSQR